MVRGLDAARKALILSNSVRSEFSSNHSSFSPNQGIASEASIADLRPSYRALEIPPQDGSVVVVLIINDLHLSAHPPPQVRRLFIQLDGDGVDDIAANH